MLSPGARKQSLRYIDADDFARARQREQHRARTTGAATKVEHPWHLNSTALQCSTKPSDSLPKKERGILSGGRDPGCQCSFIRLVELIKELAAHSCTERRISLAGRCMPSTERKKLERTVWKPSAMSVTPGITQRIVWE